MKEKLEIRESTISIPVQLLDQNARHYWKLRGSLHKRKDLSGNSDFENDKIKINGTWVKDRSGLVWDSDEMARLCISLTTEQGTTISSQSLSWLARDEGEAGITIKVCPQGKLERTIFYHFDVSPTDIAKLEITKLIAVMRAAAQKLGLAKAQEAPQEKLDPSVIIDRLYTDSDFAPGTQNELLAASQLHAYLLEQAAKAMQK